MTRLRYLLKRVVYSVLIFLAVLTLIFAWYRLIPGSVFDIHRGIVGDTFIGRGQPINQTFENTTSFIQVKYFNGDPQTPIQQAYLEYLQSIILEQDLGRSVKLEEPVFQLLFSGLPWSIFISVNGLLIGFTTELLLRGVGTITEDTRIDTLLSSLTYFTNSVPYYVVGLVGLSFLAFELGAFPVGGRFPSGVTPGLNLPFLFGLLQYAFLPLVTAIVAGFGVGLLRENHTRPGITNETIRRATLRGVTRNRIISHYILRNEAMQVQTNLVIGISVIFSSSVIIERLFNYTGIGWYLAVSMLDSGYFPFPDFSLMAGGLLFYTALTLIAILILDVVYLWVNPRAVTDDDRVLPDL